MKTGIELISIERKEQIEKHGRTIESDVTINTQYQLADAACRMAWDPEAEGFDLMKEPLFTPTGWNSEIWHRMLDKPYKERLIIAGALIAAELDRINHE